MENRLTLDLLEQVVYKGRKLEIGPEAMDCVRRSYDFLERFSREKVIYGINTGFGPMAQWRVEDAHLKELQYNIIRSHSTGAGAPLDDDQALAAMIARLGTFLQGRSGIHPELVETLLAFINQRVIPFIPQHGSVGASGDLVQLAHIALNLIGEGEVHYQGEWRPAGEVMAALGIKPVQIHIREGLSATNGTSVMTGVGCINQLLAERLLDRSVLAAVWMNEIASSYDDLMAEPLNAVRRQDGQQEIARRMRELAASSRCLRKREHETLANARRVLENELNSACDNPIVDPDTGSVYHGGNFHGDYISLEQDKVKIALVRVAMTAERQLNYLFHDRINGILPPFLNTGTLGLNYGMQACQFTATSTTAECQTLAMPNYVHSIPNNNDNQDIVSMGTNSALIAKHIIENSFQVMAIMMMSLAQAVDILKIQDKMSPATRAVYDEVRAIFPAFSTVDSPLYKDIERVENYLKTKKIDF